MRSVLGGKELRAMGRTAAAPQKGKRKQAKRPSGRLTAVILFFLLLGLSIRLVNLFQELQDAQAEEIMYAARLAELQETNKKLAEDIENRDDIELIEDFARNELGMAAPGEKILRYSK